MIAVKKRLLNVYLVKKKFPNKNIAKNSQKQKDAQNRMIAVKK